jgi:hypothetical protein
MELYVNRGTFIRPAGLALGIFMHFYTYAGFYEVDNLPSCGLIANPNVSTSDLVYMVRFIIADLEKLPASRTTLTVLRSAS